MERIFNKFLKKIGKTVVWLAPALFLPVISNSTSLSRAQPAIISNFGNKLTMLADSVDKQTGLKIAPGYTLIKANCLRCHSPKLIADKRATRDGWQATIRWMQQTQGLWDLGKAEPEILDYLTKNYAPTNEGRRPPLKNIEWYKL